MKLNEARLSVQSSFVSASTRNESRPFRNFLRSVVDAVIAERRYRASQLVATFLRDHKELTSVFRDEFERRLMNK